GQYPYVLKTKGRQQILDHVLNSSTQNSQRNLFLVAPSGEGWKCVIYLNMFSEEAENLFQRSLDSIYLLLNTLPQRDLARSELSADYSTEFNAGEGLSQEIQRIRMRDGPVEVAENGESAGM